jgi:plasmid stabilization system protein ParE
LSYSVYVRRAAERDVAVAQEWYEQQQTGLAAQFHAEFAATIDILTETPLIYPKLYRDIRRAVLHRFLTWSGFVSTIRQSPFWRARTEKSVRRKYVGTFDETRGIGVAFFLLPSGFRAAVNCLCPFVCA